MSKLHFSYEMIIKYAEPVEKCNFTIKCIPQNTCRQRIEDVTISVLPPVVYSWGKDGLGNTQIYGPNNIPHDTFVFRIEGKAIIESCEYEEIADEKSVMIFRHPHGLSAAGEKIKEYHKKLQIPQDESALEKALYVMERINKDFEYVQDVTNVDTTAEEAFAGGQGVCQDYSHIFIALMHLEKIPARYVTGMIAGEGKSHAWTEILHDGKWYGLDATNGKSVTDEYVKIGVGRDAKDCMINRGIMHGGGPQSQEINVVVNKIFEG